MTTLKIECLDVLEVLSPENHLEVQGGLTILWDRPFPIPYPPKGYPTPPSNDPRPNPRPRPRPKPVPCQCVTTPCYCAHPLPPWGPVIL